MNFDLQPTLKNAIVSIKPLKETDFDTLYQIASDPLLWEQHPNKDRYQLEVFQNFFKGALESKGAFIVYENETGKAIGSSRYYDLNETNNSITVGYTFIGRDYWGKAHNRALKTLMFDYAFQYVDKIMLHIGATNFRSQKASEKLGARKIDEQEVTYFGEKPKLNFIYQVDKASWQNAQIG